MKVLLIFFNFNFLLILLFYGFLVHLINGTGWKKLESFSCSSHNNKLLSLLNLLCNSTRTTSIQVRDGCYGCFFRAGSLSGGQQQLQSLYQCSVLYLNNTMYSGCIRDLEIYVNGTRPTTPPTSAGCYTGYCEFVRCVRKIFANNLVDDCVNRTLAGRNLSNPSDRIGWYTNATSCILAQTRCRRYNPISGELQSQNQQNNQPFLSGLTVTYSNSLQITPTGDIRVISFPSTIQIADLFCSRSTLEQSNFANFIC